MGLSFSPFDALGIPFDAYTPEQIRSRYRTAALHAHPDKRTSIPETQWPTLDHLQEARDFLTSEEDYDEYQGYPSTFDPRNEEDVYLSVPKSPFDVCTTCGSWTRLCGCIEEDKESVSFSICASCRMPLPTYRLKDHQRDDHGMCKFCEEFPLDEYKHICEEHPYFLCKICGTVDSWMRQHVEGRHCLPNCGDCAGYVLKSGAGGLDGLVCHIQGHPTCPICRQTLPNGGLWRHVRDDHEVVLCPACPKTEAELSEATKHMEEHKLQECPESTCNAKLAHAALELHLALDHGWILCDYCLSATVNETHLKEHLGGHDLRDCSVCAKKQPRDRMKQHLTEAHGWRPCPFCDEAMQEARISDHIRGNHEQCSKCKFRGNLATHLEESHAGTKCTVCGDTLPEADLERHMDAKHPRTRCAICSWKGALLDLPDHIGRHAAAGGHTILDAAGHSSTKQLRKYDAVKCDNCRKAKTKVRKLRL